MTNVQSELRLEDDMANVQGLRLKDAAAKIQGKLRLKGAMTDTSVALDGSVTGPGPKHPPSETFMIHLRSLDRRFCAYAGIYGVLFELRMTYKKAGETYELTLSAKNIDTSSIPPPGPNMMRELREQLNDVMLDVFLDNKLFSEGFEIWSWEFVTVEPDPENVEEEGPEFMFPLEWLKYYMEARLAAEERDLGMNVSLAISRMLKRSSESKGKVAAGSKGKAPAESKDKARPPKKETKKRPPSNADMLFSLADILFSIVEQSPRPCPKCIETKLSRMPMFFDSFEEPLAALSNARETSSLPSEEVTNRDGSGNHDVHEGETARELEEIEIPGPSPEDSPDELEFRLPAFTGPLLIFDGERSYWAAYVEKK
ncbi:hypothetical protein B0T20DRAFT_395673 [Sordaria brevicollis]|uniref:Uncharacterized protein n=1 Tax=Sordaria brevicollis TaxID=83679 RepID=A0AAE0U9C9_SORBR|nr:hypothetical protein B0T20DRAFT_395673 [Sordaria brevicollis]